MPVGPLFGRPAHADNTKAPTDTTDARRNTPLRRGTREIGIERETLEMVS
jgi:hypothetical protein